MWVFLFTTFFIDNRKLYLKKLTTFVDLKYIYFLAKNKESMFKLNEKVAIITGGAGVLGGAMAEGLAKAGAKVGILSRTKSKVDTKVKELKKNGYEAIALIADVLDETQLEAAKKKILKKWGSIDILVNSAGGNMKGATIMPCLLYTSPSPRDQRGSRMPSSA